MSKTDHRSTSQPRQRVLQRIDEICDTFEARCEAGESPAIEDYLGQVPREEQSRLFQELLHLDVEYLRKRGDTLDRDAYLTRYPEFHDQIKMVSSGENSWTQIHSGVEMTTDRDSECDATVDLSEAVDGTQGLTVSIEDKTRSIAGYDIIDEIARGGMGIVFKARQIDANRLVALKMILSGSLAGEKEVARFKIEAESAASLDHPAIVPIYDVGESNGVHYFSMGFINGPSLKDYLKQHSIGPRRSAEIVKTVADAISHAHSQGVIHRDLKPANILIDQQGSPRVTDFGLSKILEGQTDLTGTGQLLGTPAYMSPEQASGLTSKVGPLSDVYSLGAMLYELVSGRTPFQSESVVGMLEQVCSQDPDSLKSLSPGADTDIESICMKCLEKEPSDRYQSAAALADDLARYLEGSPIQARPTSRAQKFVRWCKRKPVIAGLAACSLITFILFGSTTAYFAVSSRRNSSIAMVERQKNDISFAIAQSAVDQMASQAKLLEDIPRTATQRKEFLAQATDFYDGFLEQRPGDQELKHQAAVLHRSMGDIFRLLGESTPAREAYNQSIGLLQDLADSQPDQVNHRRELCESYLWLGVLLKPIKVEQAIELTDQAFEIQNELSIQNPDAIANQYGLARVLYNRGLLLGERGELETAEKDYGRAVQGFKKVLPNLDPQQQRECRLYLSHTLNNFGMLLKTDGRSQEAKLKVQEAIELLADISKSRKERCELAIYQNNLSNLYASTGEVKEALEVNQESIDLLQQLVLEYPQYPDLKNSLANAFNSHGSLAGRGGQLPKAAEYFGKAETVFQELLKAHPGHVSYTNRLGTSKYNQAVVSYMQAAHGAALERLANALTLHRQALQSDSGNVEFANNLRNDYSLQIKSLRTLGRFVEMQQSIDQCLKELPRDRELHVQAAKWLAGGVKAIREQDDLATVEKASLVEAFGAKAVAELGLAMPEGPLPEVFRDGAVAEVFQPLTDRDDFQQRLAKMQSISEP